MLVWEEVGRAVVLGQVEPILEGQRSGEGGIQLEDMGFHKQEVASALCLPSPSELDVSISIDSKAGEAARKKCIQSSRPVYMALIDVSSLIMSGVMWGTVPLELIAK